MNNFDIEYNDSTIDIDLQEYFGGYYADVLPEGDA